MMNDPLNDAVLAAHLSRPFRFFQQIDSTNTAALTWLDEGAPHGALVVADEQVQGRGRLARGWVTPPGAAIAMSLILRPAYSALFVEQMVIRVGLGVAETLARYAHGIRLKWPNDVLLARRKVCGILTESVWDSDVLKGVVVGVGINIRVTFSDADLAAKATNLEDHTDKSVVRVALLVELLSAIERWLQPSYTHQLLSAYRNWLDTLNRPVIIRTGAGDVQGVAFDIDEAGALLVRRHDGTVTRVTVGDVVS